MLELRGKIEVETGLTASAGIAPNKRLAKVGIAKLDVLVWALKAGILSRWPLI